MRRIFGIVEWFLPYEGLDDVYREIRAMILEELDFRRELEKHIRSEEEELFPKLRNALGDAGNAHVTSVMNKAGFAAA